MADDLVVDEPLLWLPSDRAWLDPPLVCRQLYTQFTDVVGVSSGAVQLADLNVQRWAIGFAAGENLGGPAYVAPWSSVDSVSGRQLSSGGWLWYSLREHGPLVAGEWWGQVGFPYVVRVVEVIRQV